MRENVLRADLRRRSSGARPEDREVDARSAVRSRAVAAGTRPTRATALDQYTLDLTARARPGAIDPVLGRDPEIRQIIDILMRRRQNNPILTGEAGRRQDRRRRGLRAARSRRATCRSRCASVAIRTLDLGLLQAGAGVKGEFENRLK